jgi:L-ascorbate metabolism protein UlaG (beta-lactamase superfamily)
VDIQFYGANCVRITTKKASIIVDDNLAELGRKPVTKNGDVALFTSIHGTPPSNVKLALDQPGEYEVSDMSIQGIAARAHMDEEAKLSATMFKIIADDIRIAIVGHIYPDLNNDQLEALGTIDVLVIPVGGSGYTLDGAGALHIIKEVEPKVVIPTHYDEKGIDFPVPQVSLDAALKALSMEPHETVGKLKLKQADLPENTQLYVLEKQ